MNVNEIAKQVAILTLLKNVLRMWCMFLRIKNQKFENILQSIGCVEYDF